MSDVTFRIPFSLHLNTTPVAEDTGSESDDDRTLADILKRKESSSDPVGDSPSPGQSSPKSHLKGSRTVVLKRKASSLGDAK